MIDLLQQPRANSRAQNALALGLLLLGTGVVIAALPLKFSAVFVAGSIVFVLTLIRPVYALYLILFTVPFGSLAPVAAGPMAITATEALVGVLLIAWVVQVLAFQTHRVRFTAFFWPFVAYFAAIAASSGGGVEFALSVKEMAKWLEFGALFLIAVNVVDDHRQLQWLAVIIVGAAVLESLHGWYQFFLRVGPPSFLIGGRFLRAYGTFEQPNPYAGYLGLALPIAFGLAMTGSLRPGSPKFARTAMAIAGTVIILSAMFMSMSRGGWFGAAGALCLIMAIKSRRSFIVLIAAFAVGILMILLGSLDLLPQQIVQRLAMVTDYLRIFDARQVVVTPENWAIVQRMANWQSAWGMFADHPLLGIGIGNYPIAYYWYALPGWGTPMGHAHNYYLNVAAETGLLGLLTYVLMYAVIFGMAIRILRRFPFGWSTGRRAGTPASTILSEDDRPLGNRLGTPGSLEGAGRVSAGEPRAASQKARPPGVDNQNERTAKRRRWQFWDETATWGLALGLAGTLVAMSIHNLFDNLYVHGMAAQIAISLAMLVVAGRIIGDADARV